MLAYAHISRAISNKYIEINDKVMPIKSLLSHGVKKENGEITSKTAIKGKIGKFIADEDARHPLSDDAIKKRLENEGIVFKRRTITKYRQSLRIPPSHLRKKITSD